MTFQERARNAAAEEYGRRNYERYARREKVARTIVFALLLAAVIYVWTVS